MFHHGVGVPVGVLGPDKCNDTADEGGRETCSLQFVDLPVFGAHGVDETVCAYGDDFLPGRGNVDPWAGDREFGGPPVLCN